MAMPGRTYAAPGSLDDKYRYSHNGQEKDNDIFIGALSAEYWEYDSRTGRRWENDPITYPWQSSYATFNNNPIYFADPSGLEGEGGGDKKKEKSKKDEKKGKGHGKVTKRENGIITHEDGTSHKNGERCDGSDAKTDQNNNTGDNKPKPDTKSKDEAYKKFEQFDHDIDKVNHRLDKYMGTPKGNGEIAYVSSLKQLLAAQIQNFDMAVIEGDLLTDIKIDPEFNRRFHDFLNKSLTEFKVKKKTFYKQELGINFGPTGAFSTNNLFWALGPAQVKMFATINKEGVINVEFSLLDRLDLGPRDNGKGNLLYNSGTFFGGLLWHSYMGANRGMVTHARWSIVINPMKAKPLLIKK